MHETLERGCRWVPRTDPGGRLLGPVGSLSGDALDVRAIDAHVEQVAVGQRRELVHGRAVGSVLSAALGQTSPQIRQALPKGGAAKGAVSVGGVSHGFSFVVQARMAWSLSRS